MWHSLEVKILLCRIKIGYDKMLTKDGDLDTNYSNVHCVGLKT